MLINKIFLSLISLIIITTSVLAKEKIKSGTWSVNQTIAGYSLDNNSGERIVTLEIKFDAPFITKPKVVLAVTQLDAAKEFNLRYNIEAISVSRDGFTLKVSTWGDSRIYSMSGYWVAQAE